MCVAALAVVGTIASLAGSAMAAQGQMQQARAAKQEADYKAQQEDNAAVDAVQRGRIAQQEQRRKTGALIGRQKAVMGASNLDLSSGSPLDVLADTAMLGEFDAITIENNAAREKTVHSANAELLRTKGQNALTAGRTAATGTMIGGIGAVADKWYKIAS